MARLRLTERADLPLADNAELLTELSAEQLRAQHDSDEFKAIIQLVEQWWVQCKNARSFEEVRWFKNIDMVQGRQHTAWSSTNKRMETLPQLSHRIRTTINIIEPIIRTEITKTGKNSPTATVTPASNDMVDISAAEAAQAAWEWFYSEARFDKRVFTPANWWRAVCGIGFIKVWWDPSGEDDAAKAAASAISNAQAKAASAGADAQSQDYMQRLAPAPNPMEAKPGSIKSTFVSPFHLYIPDPAEIDLQAQPYVIHAYTLTADQAQMRYADRLPKGWSPQLVSSSVIVNPIRLGIATGATKQGDSVLVREVWIKPGYSKRFPKGGLVILVGNEIVHLAQDGMPYEHDQFPFSAITSIENGKFYRKSVVESVTPLQNEINHTIASMIERKNLSVSPQFFYQQGSLDPRKVTNKPGQYIPVLLGMNYPQHVPTPDIPSFVPLLVSSIRNFMDDISGQHQVSRATSPGANTAASAVSLLQEADDDYLFTTFQSIEDAMEQVGRQVLALMVQYWDEPRMIKVVGNGNSFDVKQLMGSDLEHGTDLRMESGSALPLSKAGRIATIESWIKAGIIPADVGLEAMEMGTLGKVYSRIKVDRAQAQRENVQMRDLDPQEIAQQYAQIDAQAQQRVPEPAPAPVAPVGPTTAGGPPLPLTAPPVPTPPPPPPPIYAIGWQDNDQVHMQEHADYAKSEQFQQLDPVIQRVFQEHYYAHMTRSQQLAMFGAQMTGEQLGAVHDAEGLKPGTANETQRRLLTT